MILSIGEILADVVLEKDGKMEAFLGGAPFNAAVAAAKAGAKVRFLGRIGDDPMGKFLTRESQKYPVETILQVDPVRPTTLAFVSLDETGERDFKFLRHDAADPQIEVSNEILSDVTFVHLGSLMLSEESGRKIAKTVLQSAKKMGKKISFDVNFRTDIFRDEQAAKDAYLPVIRAADVVKFSEEETEILFGKQYIEALKSDIQNPISVVTLGKKGCAIQYKGEIFTVPSLPVKPIDTTGAGDAFYGTFLGELDRFDFAKLTADDLKTIAAKANVAGAEATQHKGALL